MRGACGAAQVNTISASVATLMQELGLARRHEEALVRSEELIPENGRVRPLALVRLQDGVLLLLHRDRQRIRRPRQRAHARGRLEGALRHADECRNAAGVHEISEAVWIEMQ